MRDEFEALALRVKAARREDRRLTAIMKAAQDEWKIANEALTAANAEMSALTATMIANATRLDDDGDAV